MVLPARNVGLVIRKKAAHGGYIYQDRAESEGAIVPAILVENSCCAVSGHPIGHPSARKEGVGTMRASRTGTERGLARGARRSETGSAEGGARRGEPQSVAFERAKRRRHKTGTKSEQDGD